MVKKERVEFLGQIFQNFSKISRSIRHQRVVCHFYLFPKKPKVLM